MTDEDVLASVLANEGGYVDNPNDRGGATNFGITAAVLGEWRKLGRTASRDEVRNLSKTEATSIYRAIYLKPFDAIKNDALRAQLCDYGVLSGTRAAIIALQEVLSVPDDGILGAGTLAALASAPAAVVNAALVAKRVKLFVGLVAKDSTQREFFYGWCRRAVSFL